MDTKEWLMYLWTRKNDESTYEHKRMTNVLMKEWRIYCQRARTRSSRGIRLVCQERSLLYGIGYNICWHDAKDGTSWHNKVSCDVWPLKCTWLIVSMECVECVTFGTNVTVGMNGMFWNVGNVMSRHVMTSCYESRGYGLWTIEWYIRGSWMSSSKQESREKRHMVSNIKEQHTGTSSKSLLLYYCYLY